MMKMKCVDDIEAGTPSKPTYGMIGDPTRGGGLHPVGTRWLSALVILAMLFSLLCAAGGAAAEGGNVVIDTDFDDGTPQGWTAIEPTAGVNTSHSHSGNYSMHVYNGVTQYDFSPVSSFSTAKLSFWIYLDGSDEGYEDHITIAGMASSLTLSGGAALILSCDQFSTPISYGRWTFVQLDYGPASYSMSVDGSPIPSSEGGYLCDYSLWEDPHFLSIGPFASGYDYYLDDIHLGFDEPPQLKWAPSFTSTPATAATVGNIYSYSLACNETVTFGIELPGWLTLSGSSLSGTPSSVGLYDVKISATSGNGTLVAYQNFTIAVSAAGGGGGGGGGGWIDPDPEPEPDLPDNDSGGDDDRGFDFDLPDVSIDAEDASKAMQLGLFVIIGVILLSKSLGKEKGGKGGRNGKRKR
jgi:hypothetical protein